MNHLLTLDLPAKVYESLCQVGERTGKPLEQVAVDWLVAAIQQATPDPMESFIGAWHSDIVAWPDRHDSHIGSALAKDS